VTAHGTVVVAAAVAQRPRFGGHAWVFFQYLIGLRRLGYDVLLLDRGDAADISWLANVTNRYAIPYLVVDEGDAGRREVKQHLSASLAVLDVMGFLGPAAVLPAARRRVFLDIDPGFGQMWRELGLADVLAGHDVFVTIGENIGEPWCCIPDCGLDWFATRAPVALDEWPVTRPARDVFTTVASWRGQNEPVDFAGTRYGLRCHEFRKFLELPRITGQKFELALEIHPADASDRAHLERAGWMLADPRVVAGDPSAYRQYVQGSLAEICVAKNMYVQTKSGWFSDRSACYLASGKPVLHQDTGLRHIYPSGEGLFIFSTLDEAAAAVDAIRSDYERHSRAARAIAEEFFDAKRVVSILLEKVSVA
jgi:hypothetical protein